MEKRQLKNGFESSLLGYGCMRLPVNEDGKIDEKKTEELLMKAYESGVTYFDTAYPYHDGESERVVGKILKKLDRSTFTLATKLPCWFINSLDDVKKYFDEQLSKLQTDYIDFYLLHALNGGSFKKMRDLGVIEELVKYKEKGLIKNLGFSFHDDYKAFEEIINYRDWDFCQIQLNYIDKDTQATMKGVELSMKKNFPLVIMEPVKGGSLAKLPDEIFDILKPFKRDLSAAGWALSWVASCDNVKVILSGMTTMDQLTDNLKTFDNFKALSDEEMAAVDKVATELEKRAKNGCTGCRYCMPCPMGVNIPRCFSIWNNYHKYDNVGEVKWAWNSMPEAERPDACKKCGVCEGKCPQKLNIRADLEALNKELKEL